MRFKFFIFLQVYLRYGHVSYILFLDIWFVVLIEVNESLPPLCFPSQNSYYTDFQLI